MGEHTDLIDDVDEISSADRDEAAALFGDAEGDIWIPPEVDDPPTPQSEQEKSDTPTDRGPSDDELSAHIRQTATGCLAAQQGRTGTELLEMFDYILSTTDATDMVSGSTVRLWKRAREVAAAAYADFGTDMVDFADVPELDAAPGKVRELYATFLTFRPVPARPVAVWSALRERLRRVVSLRKANDYVSSLGYDLPAEDLLEAYKAIPAPVTTQSEQQMVFTKSAAEWEADHKAALSLSSPYRLSSGYPSWDRAMTARGSNGKFCEPLGTFAPGEFCVIGGPTGNGKSALGRPMAAAIAQDLRNWGRCEDKVLIGITEETPTIVYQAAGLAAGQSKHHLADNVVISNWGASRVRVVHSVWSLVVAAYERSKATGKPIVDCGLPAVIIWDYIGGTAEAGEDPDKTAVERSANLALRGFAQWNVDDMETFTGEKFSAYAGMSWPSGMEHFKPAVIAFAQFVKLKEPTYFDPDSPKCKVQDFVVENADGDPAWEVRPGDFRVPTQTEVRGSGVLINHATTLMILHRSRPGGRNPILVDQETGRTRLEDDRARFLLVKTRNGASSPVVPMRFDSQYDGPRGQFYDPLEELITSSCRVAPGYSTPGDPVLPPRPTRSVAAMVTYV